MVSIARKAGKTVAAVRSAEKYSSGASTRSTSSGAKEVQSSSTAIDSRYEESSLTGRRRAGRRRAMEKTVVQSPPGEDRDETRKDSRKGSGGASWRWPLSQASSPPRPEASFGKASPPAVAMTADADRAAGFAVTVTSVHTLAAASVGSVRDVGKPLRLHDEYTSGERSEDETEALLAAVKDPSPTVPPGVQLPVPVGSGSDQLGLVVDGAATAVTAAATAVVEAASRDVGPDSLSGRPSRAERLGAVTAVWVSHTASVYATKTLLSLPGRTTHGVVLITWCQCMTSWMLVLCLGTLGERLEAKNSRQYPGLLSELARALPANALLGGWNSKTLLGGGAGAVGVASVLFSLAVFSDNACLGVVNASFFQVARALTLPFVTVIGALKTRSLPPRDLIVPCVLCAVGFGLGVQSQTPEAFIDGTSLGVLASFLTALYTLLLARAESREAWRITYVTNRNASVLLIPVTIYVGLGDPDLSGAPFMLRDRGTFLLAILVCILPAISGVSTLWQAQAGLGARGQAASFVGRAACAHTLAFAVFGNAPVLIGEVGCCLVLMGLVIYASQRGGAAVAQAGNVAVPAAARDHFLYRGVTLVTAEPLGNGVSVIRNEGLAGSVGGKINCNDQGVLPGTLKRKSSEDHVAGMEGSLSPAAGGLREEGKGAGNRVGGTPSREVVRLREFRDMKFTFIDSSGSLIHGYDHRNPHRVIAPSGSLSLPRRQPGTMESSTEGESGGFARVSHETVVGFAGVTPSLHWIGGLLGWAPRKGPLKGRRARTSAFGERGISPDVPQDKRGIRMATADLSHTFGRYVAREPSAAVGAERTEEEEQSLLRADDSDGIEGEGEHEDKDGGDPTNIC